MVLSTQVFGTFRRIVAGLLVLALLQPAVPAAAQDAAPTDWQPLSLQDPIVQLFTPRSGAFIALAKTALYRSDDGGASWQSVPTPHLDPVPMHYLDADQRFTGQVAVDPGNHQNIYLNGMDGLYRTADGGRTWQLAHPGGFAAVAVSPVTSQLVYMVQSEGQLARSQDAGQTWQDVPGQSFGGNNEGAGHTGVYGCGISAMLFPHPQVADRLILSIICHSGRDENQSSAGNIDQSFDQGLTRVAFLRPSWVPAYHGLLVGGQGTAPSRFYTTTNTSSFSLFRTPQLNSRMVRSDDDGAHWTEVTGIWDDPGDTSFVQIGGLVEDPANPDTLYVGLNQFTAHPPLLGYPRPRSWVRTSTDGGQTWADVGCTDFDSITDLALGIDSKNLYAGTQAGLWRLPLPNGSAPQFTCNPPTDAP